MPHAGLLRLAERFGETVLSCPDRLWRDPWHRLRMVFVLRGQRTAVSLARSPEGTWVARPVSLARAEYSQLAEAKGEYSILRTPTSSTIAVFLRDLRERSLERAVEVAAHEAFHVAGQRGFGRAGRMDRGREIPADWMYRYARVMLVQRLQDAYDGAAPLGKAAYWYHEITAEHLGAKPHAARLLDRIEGSAQYVGVLAIGLYHAGCLAGDEDLRRRAWRSFSERSGQRRYANLSADAPSYLTGLIAGFLLDASGDNTWKRQVEDGASPAEILLGSRSPEHDEGDAQLRQSTRAWLAREDEAYLPRLKELRSRVADGEDFVVAMATGRAAFPPSSIASWSDEGGLRYLLLGLTMRFSDAAGRLRVELRGQDVMEARSTPCGRGARWVFPVSRASVAFAEETVSVEGPAVSIAGARKTESRWICLD